MNFRFQQIQNDYDREARQVREWERDAQIHIYGGRRIRITGLAEAEATSQDDIPDREADVHRRDTR